MIVCRNSLFLLALLCFTLCCMGQQIPSSDPLSKEPTGELRIGGLPFSVTYFSKDFSIIRRQSALKVASGFPTETQTEWKTSGTLQLENKEQFIRLDQSVQALAPQSYRVTYNAAPSSDDLSAASFSVEIALPVSQFAGKPILVDGVATELPKSFANQTLVNARSVRQLVLPGTLGAITISGNLSILVQDDRKWKNDLFLVRLYFPRSGDLLPSTSLTFQLQYKPYTSSAIDLAPVGNRSFHDEVAGDKKGGWTDQGPGNDLSALQPGPLNVGGITFQIADAQANLGKSCIVVAGQRQHDGLPTGVTVPISGKPVWSNLYLLHACAWTPQDALPVGQMTVTYTDATAQQITVVAHRDVENWWLPSPSLNGVVAWTGANPSSSIGLVVSKFALHNKPIENIRLEGSQHEGARQSVWMIAAMSGSPDDIALPRNMPLTISSSQPEWAPYAYGPEIAAGSVFDFSALADAPAGKHGPIIVTPEGQFAFTQTPGKRERFWGVNLCFGVNFSSREQADCLADQLMRSGYNVARLHHFDEWIIKRGAAYGELDPAPLDRLDYLFAALKKRGIYVNIDLYTLRKFKTGEVPDLGTDIQHEIKSLIPVSDAAFEAWARFARHLLMHKNPHTGMTWGEDPALIGICPVNEDTLLGGVLRAESPTYRLYERKFRDKRGLSDTDQIDPAQMNLFITELQAAADQRMREFIRTLGVKTPLTGVNMHSRPSLTVLREHYDYVDNHDYWDHPRFPKKYWSLPNLFTQQNPVTGAAGLPRLMMPSRLIGKPFSVTEFHYCWPNMYRAAGGPLMVAYAGLQDWDALYNFDYITEVADIDTPKGINTLDLVKDPISLLADRANAMIFRRGDVAAAPGLVAYLVDSEAAHQGKISAPQQFPESLSHIGLVTRIGSMDAGNPSAKQRLLSKGDELRALVTEKNKLSWANVPAFAATDDLADQLISAGVLSRGAVTQSGKLFTSETGQITLSTAKGHMKLVTSASECFVLPPYERISGTVASIENGPAFSTAYVVAVDSKPLNQSRRILVLHLTDGNTEGTQFSDSSRTLLEVVGTGPYLVRAGTAVMRIKSSDSAVWQAWALDNSGARRWKIPIERTDSGELALRVSTVNKQGTVLAYELVAQ